MDDRLQKCPQAYLTQESLKDIYKDYDRPRDRISFLVQKGDLIPIKRELYLLGEKYKRSYSRETIANLIYGPSAVSFEYALSYHELIPEKVETVTSICFKRNKKFQTPLGNFTYRYIPAKLFPLGIELHTADSGNFLMACPEKALCDIVYFHKLGQDEIHDFVVENLRIEEEAFLNLNSELLMKLATIYKRPSVMNLVKAQISMKGN